MPLPSKTKPVEAKSALAPAKTAIKEQSKTLPNSSGKKVPPHSESPNDTIKLETKPERRKVIIPYVLPWESRPSVQNQHGMKAFGTSRNIFTKIEPGKKELPKDTVLKSENVVPRLHDNVDLATQKGMKMGCFRDNVLKYNTAGREMGPEMALACQGIIPRQSGSNESHGQAGLTPIGALRLQVPRVHFKENMSDSMDSVSKGFLGRFSTPNPNCHAGTAVIDKLRKQVPEGHALLHRRLKGQKSSESILPKFQVRNGLDTCQGTGAGTHGLGPFRQVVTPVTGGYNFTDEEVISSKKQQPWATSASLASQRGTGGFQQKRDVVNRVKYQF